jgi:hypothetical protein
MTSDNEDRTTLFLAPPTAEAADRPRPDRDGSAEAMRLLRHPFVVAPSESERGGESDNGRERSVSVLGKMPV